MSAKIQKTLARQKEKIAEGNYYEAHQQLRVVTARYLKASPPDYVSAADILSSGALLLLSAGQGGSGGDLATTLVTDVYQRGAYPITTETKNRAVEILKAFPADEPTRKKYIQELTSWAVKTSEDDRGDSELHHEIGLVLAANGEAYDAERHLLLGKTPESATALALMHYQWYAADSPHTASVYASRSVLPWLVLGNLRAASTALALFTSQLLTLNPSIPTQSIDGLKSSVRLFPSLPLLNYLSLLLLGCQKGDASLFKQLSKHYATHLKEMNELWGESLANIGEIWFGIRIPKQGNPLMDMMGSMLFGGGKKQAKPLPKPAAENQPLIEKPVAMDLD